jgi:hydrogenase-4 membrane subunit HyfE
MSAETVAESINALAIGMVVLAVGLVWTRSTRQAVLLVALQSVLLGSVGLVAALHTDREHLLVGAGLVFAVKAICLPALMWFLISRARANGEMPSALPRGSPWRPP